MQTKRRFPIHFLSFSIQRVSPSSQVPACAQHWPERHTLEIVRSRHDELKTQSLSFPFIQVRRWYAKQLGGLGQREEVTTIEDLFLSDLEHLLLPKGGIPMHCHSKNPLSEKFGPELGIGRSTHASDVCPPHGESVDPASHTFGAPTSLD